VAAASLIRSEMVVAARAATAKIGMA